MSLSKADHLHWASVKERGGYLGLSIMFGIYRFFGRRVFSIFLYPVMGYFFIAHADARRASFEFLTRVSGYSGRRPPKWRHVFRHFVNFGESLLDKLEAWTGRINMDSIVYENKHVAADLYNRKTGCVLLSAHIGNMELSHALSEVHKTVSATVLVHTKHADNFNRIVQEANPNSSLSIIQVSEVGPNTVSLLRERIDQGGCVVILGDRFATGNSKHCSHVPFLGATAPFPQGPFILASMLECPVILIFCIKEAGRHRIIFEPFADSINLPRRRRQDALRDLIARYAARVEAYCVRYPYQWFNFFDFWRQFDKDGERR